MKTLKLRCPVSNDRLKSMRGGKTIKFYLDRKGENPEEEKPRKAVALIGSKHFYEGTNS